MSEMFAASQKAERTKGKKSARDVRVPGAYEPYSLGDPSVPEVHTQAEADTLIQNVKKQAAGEEHRLAIEKLSKSVLSTRWGRALLYLMSSAMGIEAGGAFVHPSGLSRRYFQSDENIWEEQIAVMDQHASTERHPSHREMYRFLEERLGHVELSRMLPGGLAVSETADQAMARRQQEQQEPRVTVEGADLINMTNEELREYVVEGYPRNFTSQTAVRRIRVTGEHIPINPEYGIHGNEAGDCTVSDGNLSSDITITTDGLGDQNGAAGVRLLMNEVVAHELTHDADQRSQAHIPAETRLTTLYMATQRVLSADALQFSYVNDIHNADSQRQLAYRVTEYIPETARAMFGYRLSQLTGGVVRKGLQPTAEQLYQGMAMRLAEDYHSTPEAAAQDVQMIVNLVGSDFDWVHAAETRERILHHALVESALRPIREQIQVVSDPELRTQLSHLFEASRASMNATYHYVANDPQEARTIPEGSMETHEQAELHLTAHLQRLSHSVSGERAQTLRAWGRLVGAVVDARDIAWHEQEVSDATETVTEHLVAARQAMELHMNTYHQADPHLRRAMTEYARAIGYAQFPLPQHLTDRMHVTTMYATSGS